MYAVITSTERETLNKHENMTPKKRVNRDPEVTDRTSDHLLTGHDDEDDPRRVFVP